MKRRFVEFVERKYCKRFDLIFFSISVSSVENWKIFPRNTPKADLRERKKKKKKRKERQNRMENKYLRLDCAQLKTPSMEFARCIVSQDRREASLHHPGSALLPAPGFLSTLIYRKPSNQSLCTLEDVDVSNCNGS